MYEYIAELERWKKINTNYIDKFKVIQNFVLKCQDKCLGQYDCLNLCKKPLVDIERFNTYMIKRLSTDVYDICSEKVQLDFNSNIAGEINKLKICSESLYRENEVTVKKETLERLDDIMKFLNN
jgi:hypothetical protein